MNAFEGVGSSREFAVGATSSTGSALSETSTPERSVPETERSDLVVVANRLAMRFDEQSGGWVVSPGGLVSALRPVLRERQGIWLGWNDSGKTLPRSPDLQVSGMVLEPSIGADFYDGFANRSLWPALHGMTDRVEQRIEWWEAYRSVNRRFARRVCKLARPGATVWVHDYHFLLLPGMVSALRPDVTIGLFLHTPVADPRSFSELHDADALLAGMAGATLIGTQRQRDRDCLADLYTSRSRPEPGIAVHPISVDVKRIQAIVQEAATKALAERVRSRTASGRRIILGVDRMDYTKGIPHRLDAFERLLATGLVSANDAMFIQIASPSREDVPAYRRLRQHVMTMARRINEMYPSSRGPVVKVISENVPFREVMAHYLAADVAVVSPLRDGMNLVCKEFVVARAGDPVSLILSAGAGAADELGDHALMIDPTDALGFAAALHTALTMPDAQRRERSRALANRVAKRDVFMWADDFLADLAGRHGAGAPG